MPRFSRLYYRRDPVAVARDLLGQRLVRVLDGRRLAGRIVETEAYLGIPDKGAHTYGGRRTRRTATMWGEAGHAYVYFTYGMHHCLNAVCGEVGDPVAVLIRALQPEEGQTLMGRHRPRARKETDLCSGPGKLCQALAIDRTLDGADLVVGDALFIEEARTEPLPAEGVTVTTRVGIAYAQEWAEKPLRFYLKDNPHVSKR